MHVHREHKGQVAAVAIAIQDVEDGAAGRLVRFQEDNVVLWGTCATLVVSYKARGLLGVTSPAR